LPRRRPHVTQSGHPALLSDRNLLRFEPDWRRPGFGGWLRAPA